MDCSQLERVIEGALLAAGQPLSIKKLQSLFVDIDEENGDECNLVTAEAIKEALLAIASACEGRGFELKEVGSGYRFQVRQEVSPWVNRLWDERPQKYSRALLETLALIAYRQPITRGDIEEIRGVAVSSHIMKTLIEREWVKVVGHRDVPGRPSLFATTKKFLDYFNLQNLDELPTLGELRDLDELGPKMNPELDLQGGGVSESIQEDDGVPGESDEIVEESLGSEILDSGSLETPDSVLESYAEEPLSADIKEVSADEVFSAELEGNLHVNLDEALEPQQTADIQSELDIAEPKLMSESSQDEIADDVEASLSEPVEGAKSLFAS